MFNFNIGLTIPFLTNVFKHLFSVGAKITETVAFEVESYYSMTTLFSMDVTLRSQGDHSGLSFEIALLGLTFGFNIYSVNHETENEEEILDNNNDPEFEIKNTIVSLRKAMSLTDQGFSSDTEWVWQFLHNEHKWVLVRSKNSNTTGNDNYYILAPYIADAVAWKLKTSPKTYNQDLGVTTQAYANPNVNSKP